MTTYKVPNWVWKRHLSPNWEKVLSAAVSKTPRAVFQVKLSARKQVSVFRNTLDRGNWRQCKVPKVLEIQGLRIKLLSILAEIRHSRPIKFWKRIKIFRSLLTSGRKRMVGHFSMKTTHISQKPSTKVPQLNFSKMEMPRVISCHRRYPRRLQLPLFKPKTDKS